MEIGAGSPLYMAGYTALGSFGFVIRSRGHKSHFTVTDACTPFCGNREDWLKDAGGNTKCRASCIMVTEGDG